MVLLSNLSTFHKKSEYFVKPHSIIVHFNDKNLQISPNLLQRPGNTGQKLIFLSHRNTDCLLAQILVHVSNEMYLCKQGHGSSLPPSGSKVSFARSMGVSGSPAARHSLDDGKPINNTILQVGNPAHNIQLFLFLLIFKFSLEIYEMCSNSMRLFDMSKKAPSFTHRSKPVGQVLGWSRLPHRWNTTTSKQCI